MRLVTGSLTELTNLAHEGQEVSGFITKDVLGKQLSKSKEMLTQNYCIIEYSVCLRFKKSLTLSCVSVVWFHFNFHLKIISNVYKSTSKVIDTLAYLRVSFN